MNSIADIALINDVINLPKTTLQELCTDLNLDNKGYKADLVTRIYDYIQQHRGSQSEIFESSKQKLLAGKTALTWYKLDNSITSDEFRELVTEKSDANPFETVDIPILTELTTSPSLLSGAVGLNENEVYLRFAYKSGVRQDPYGTDITTTPKSGFSTVYFDSNSSILEIRGDTRKADEIASIVAGLLDQRVNLEPVEIPFNQTIGQIADNLEGELIDATSKPEFILEDFDEEQTNAVGNVLLALDEFFSTNDTELLEEQLNYANQAFDNQITVPFSALILSGMGKVGLGGQREIRGLPLYDYLNPNLQHQGGYIRFNFHEAGLEKSYTIRVGMTTKSIYFSTPSTEDVISHVRSNVILNI
ncbi:hypothetical protein SAMN04488072_102168 [Lentibacillus halodurans]|uniref:SAP domain-containing protein n=1 Tax=Lentibacillus halodurans TaxID=237679 RepID=A0A1I0W2Y8_9BACI|nr:hypothetical protein [Lentibacillus halodurans]SFA82981.1 hypothetical protein SAMN04488072_102168 [Lentibacillus halodurans]